MTLQQLRYLAEVVKQDLNISRAAHTLHVSQPGLSRQVQLLEHELGVELFVRNRRRLVRLSPAGAEYTAWRSRCSKTRETSGKQPGSTPASTRGRLRSRRPTRRRVTHCRT